MKLRIGQMFIKTNLTMKVWRIFIVFGYIRDFIVDFELLPSTPCVQCSFRKF